MAKKAAVINDLSGFGKCSLNAAIAVLSAFGIQPCSIPTAVLTNQTQFPIYKTVDFTEHMPDYIDIWKKNNASFDGIYSGYIANSKQVDFITEFIDTFKDENTLVLVDPVMGDNGEVYREYSREMCDKMGELAAKADFITPNLTELCILTGNDYFKVSGLPFRAKISAVEEMAYSLADKNNQTVTVTGIIDDDKIYNGVFGQNIELLVTTKYYNISFSGTGDLFASTFFGSLMQGFSTQKALETAGKFIEISILDTICQEYIDPNYGVEFEKNLGYLMRATPAGDT